MLNAGGGAVTLSATLSGAAVAGGVASAVLAWTGVGIIVIGFAILAYGVYRLFEQKRGSSGPWQHPDSNPGDPPYFITYKESSFGLPTIVVFPSSSLSFEYYLLSMKPPSQKLIRIVLWFGFVLTSLATVEFFWLLGPKDLNSWLMLLTSVTLLALSRSKKSRPTVKLAKITSIAAAVILIGSTITSLTLEKSGDGEVPWILVGAWCIAIGGFLVQRFGAPKDHA